MQRAQILTVAEPLAEMPIAEMPIAEMDAVAASAGFIEPADGLPIFLGESWDDHIAAWKGVRQELTNRQWQLGAIAASVETKYGGRSLQKFAKEVNEKLATISDYRRVYVTFQVQTAEPEVLPAPDEPVEAEAPQANTMPENRERSRNSGTAIALPPNANSLSWSHYRKAAAAEKPMAIIKKAAEEGLSVRETERLLTETVITEASLDEVVQSLMTEHQRGLWDDYLRAARGLGNHFPLLRAILSDCAKSLKEELGKPPQTIRDRIVGMFAPESGFDYISVEDVAASLSMPREVCLALLRRLVGEGTLKADEKPRAPGARGATQKVYLLTNSQQK